MSEYDSGRMYGGGGDGGNRLGDEPGRVRFEAISDGFRLLSQQMGPWLIAMLLCLVLGAIVGVVSCGGMMSSMGPMLGGMSGGIKDGPGQMPGTSFWISYFVMLIVNMVFGALIAAGMMHMALRQVRGESIRVNDLFGATYAVGRMIGTSLLLAVLLYGAEIAALAPTIGIGIATHNPGIMFFGVILVMAAMLLVFTLTLMAWPLIVDREMGPWTAMRTSLAAMKRDWATAAGVVLVLGIINALAALPFGLGLLFTYPATFLTVAVIYRDLFALREGYSGPMVTAAAASPVVSSVDPMER